MKYTFRMLTGIILLLGHTTLATAVTIDFVDTDPFVGAQYIGATGLSYSHDVTDNGYNPLTDTVMDAWLTIYLVDDQSGDPTAVGTVMYDFYPTDDGEISVTEGEEVTVLGDYGEWLFVRNESGEEGYVPASYVQGGGWVETEWFNLSFDGFTQGIYQVTGEVYNFSVPNELLFDGVLGIVINSESGDFDFSEASLNVTVDRATVPEPASIILLSLGLFVLGAFAKIKTRPVSISSSYTIF